MFWHRSSQLIVQEQFEERHAGHNKMQKSGPRPNRTGKMKQTDGELMKILVSIGQHYYT